MGATMSGSKATVACRPHGQAHVSSTTDHASVTTSSTGTATGLNLSSSRDNHQEDDQTASTAAHAHALAPNSLLQDMMMSSLSSATNGDHNNGGREGLTRDFLGLRAFSHSDILSIAGLGNGINISRDQNQKPW